MRNSGKKSKKGIVKKEKEGGWRYENYWTFWLFIGMYGIQ
jgi:hypothetical protein